VDSTKLTVARNTLAKDGQLFLSKQHIATNKLGLLQTEGIVVMNIIRDIRDMILSRYHQEVRLHGLKLPLDQFLEQQSEQYIQQYVQYHRSWISDPERSRSNYFMASYEMLLDDTPSEVARIFTFLGIELPEETKQVILKKTSFERAKKKGPGEFLRKGKAGSYLEEMSVSESENILKMADHHGLRSVKAMIAEFEPMLAPTLRQTDVGLPVLPAA
jgi:hypothetical protein